ncbi:MAG TPA: hypothetical protein VFV34_08830 [Blastocatellia bacterium]|nr:hypothetical protein [Blastocatellia bacterium]
MRLRDGKWTLLVGAILLAVAVGLSRVQMDRRAGVMVGLLEVTVAGLIGVFLGVSAVRKNQGR